MPLAIERRHEFVALWPASLLQRFEIGHDVLDLAGLKLEPRHRRMNALR